MSGQCFSCWFRRERARTTENELRGLLLLAFGPAVLALWLSQRHSPESGEGRQQERSASYSKSREQEEEETGPRGLLLSTLSVELRPPAQEERSLHGQGDEEHRVLLLVRLAGSMSLDSWQSSGRGMGERMEGRVAACSSS